MEKYRKKGGENGDDHYLSMNITQLNSSALKTTSLGKQILLNEVMGHFRQLFTSRHSIRIGWNDALFKSKKLKDKDSNPYAIINRLKYNSNIIGEKEVQQQSPIACLQTGLNLGLFLRPQIQVFLRS